MDFQQYIVELDAARRGATGRRRGPENVVALASTTSTNLVARGMASDYDSEGLNVAPTLILAFQQTGGRGRQGRHWTSPRGRGVYATLAQPFDEPSVLPTLPLLVGVGLCRVLSSHLAAGCRLKWPNDLVVPRDDGRGSKIGGVLIETRVHSEEGGVALIGFGVNHSHERADLPEGATSLRLEGVVDLSLAELTWQLVAGVEAELAHAGDMPHAITAYRELSLHRPGDHLAWHVGEREVSGTFAGFDEIGQLQLRPTDGGAMVSVSAGEVIET